MSNGLDRAGRPIGSSRYAPRPGDSIVVELPGERTRATIEEVVSDDMVLVTLQNTFSNKNHSYKANESLIPVVRRRNALGEFWEDVDERYLEAARQASAGDEEA